MPSSRSASSCSGALWLLFHRTRWGTLVRAATEDREMVGALGVNQAWLFTGTFFLGSMLAGLGGAAQLPKGGADLLMDFNILAAVFVVVVVGRDGKHSPAPFSPRCSSRSSARSGSSSSPRAPSCSCSW